MVLDVKYIEHNPVPANNAKDSVGTFANKFCSGRAENVKDMISNWDVDDKLSERSKMNKRKREDDVSESEDASYIEFKDTNNLVLADSTNLDVLNEIKELKRMITNQFNVLQQNHQRLEQKVDDIMKHLHSQGALVDQYQ